MKLESIFSEAIRNIKTGTAHAILLVVLVMCSGMVLGGYEAYTVKQMETKAMERIAAFADVNTIAGGEVDGVACDQLATTQQTRITQSGAVRTGGDIALSSTPNKTLQVYEVTPGMLSMIVSGSTGNSNQIKATGIWVPTEVAHDFGLVVGSTIPTDKGDMAIEGIYEWPNDGRDTRFAYTFVIPQSASGDVYEECWAKQWPQSESNNQLLYSTLIAGNIQSQAGIMPINKNFDSSYVASQEYRQRITRFLPWIACIAGCAIGAIAVRRRRLEFASALHSGQTKGAQLCGISLETLIWAGLGSVCSSVLLTAYIHRCIAVDSNPVLFTVLKIPFAMFAGCLAASIISGLCIRQSQLFKLFKQR